MHNFKNNLAWTIASLGYPNKDFVAHYLNGTFFSEVQGSLNIFQKKKNTFQYFWRTKFSTYIQALRCRIYHLENGIY